MRYCGRKAGGEGGCGDVSWDLDLWTTTSCGTVDRREGRGGPSTARGHHRTGRRDQVMGGGQLYTGDNGARAGNRSRSRRDRRR